MSETREIFEELKAAIRATAGDPVKRKEIRDMLEEAAKKVGDIAKR